MDGVAFEGESGENHDLVLGSHSFIDTFEDQLVGKKAGEECEVNVTFPEDYGQKDLAGKPAMFKVTVKKIQMKELPAIDDEFAKDVSEFDTLEEYKADVREKLTQSKQKQEDERIRRELLEKAVANAEMIIPGPMVDEQGGQHDSKFCEFSSVSGNFYGAVHVHDRWKYRLLRASVRPDAERRIKDSLVLEAIAKAENLEITDEDFEKEVADMAETYHMEVEAERVFDRRRSGEHQRRDEIQRRRWNSWWRTRRKPDRDLGYGV
ncbi:MAG: trigger factor [Clostridia bacterium]